MSAHDDFIATVGVTLIERAGCLPWTSPVPPALGAARGWFQPGAAGASIVLVLRADGLAELPAIVEAWRQWLVAVRADEAALLLVTSEPTELATDWPEHPRWDPWWVDLEGRRVERLGATADEPAGDVAPPPGSFRAGVDAAVMAYFDGPTLTLADLSEEERARLAGKAPFLAFLDAQPAPASYVILGIVLGMYMLTTSLTVPAAEIAKAPAAVDAGRMLWRGFLDASPVALLKLGATLRPLVEAGEAWRLIAANYLHGNLLHLFVNVYSLAVMAPTLEKIFGTPKFLAIWTMAGVTGAALSVAVNLNALSVGASGALFGLLGALIALSVRFRGAIPAHQIRSFRHIALIALGINFILGATTPQIDNMAHLGGLLGGFFTAILLGPHPALIGRPAPRWATRALWIFPVVSLMALATGLASAATGRVPAVPMAGPAGDFRVTVPVDVRVERSQTYLIIRNQRADRFVLVHGVPNPEGKAFPAATGDAADARVYDVARRYAAQGAIRPDSPTIVAVGDHRWVRFPVTMPEGTREAIDVTATPRRIYIVRTRGLGADPWIGAMRDEVLRTFETR